MLRAALCGLLAAGCGAEAERRHKPNLPLRWVLLEVHSEGVRVARERGLPPGATSVDAARHTREEAPHDDSMFSVEWGHGAGRERAHFFDPRRVIHEHFDDHGGDINGTHVHHEHGYVSLRLPYHLEHAPHLEIVEHAHEGWASHGPRPMRRHHFDVLEGGAERRHASTLAGAAGGSFPFVPELQVIQKVGPVDSTYNIAILAGCYAPGSRDKWDSVVSKLTRFMRGTTLLDKELLISGTPLNSQPTNRYFSHFNVFAVWDESPQDGANHPNADGYVADPKPNRLQCSYGTTIKRLLACNFAETYALASHAPGADLIMVMVNDDEYGGAGGGGMAWLYTGEMMERVFHHEMGHAAADLGDEYDYGFSESKNIRMKNCAFDANAVTWSKWQDHWKVVGEPHEPFPICSYTNYVRPRRGTTGDDVCLMRSSGIASMCDVCREGMLTDGFFGPKKGIDFTLPRCPLEQETLVVRENSIGRLHVNPIMQDFFMYHQLHELFGPAFKVAWSCRSAPAGVPCNGVTILQGDTDTASLTVGSCEDPSIPLGNRGCGWPGGATAALGDYTVQVDVTDTVADALSGGWTDVDRSSTQTFRFRVVDEAGFAMPGNKCSNYDCNVRYGRGTGSDCDAKSDSGSCTAAGCHWTKTLGKCERFYGRHDLGSHAEDKGYKICTICDGGDESACNVSFSVTIQDAEAFMRDGAFDFGNVNFKKIEDSINEGYWFVLVGGAVIAVLMLFGLYRTCHDLRQKDVSLYSKCNKHARFAGMIIFALTAWGGVAMAAYGVFEWLQTETELLDDVWMILFIIGGCVVFFLSLFVFGAISSRGPVRLGISFVLMTITVAFMTVITVFLIQLSQASQGSVNQASQETDQESAKLEELGADVAFMNELRDAWVTSVAKFPKTVCTLENDYRCSGFQKSCFNVRQASSYCPEECPIGNAFINPCAQVLQKRLHDNFITLSSVSITITVTVFIGTALTFYLFIAATCCAPDAADRDKKVKKKQVKPKPAESAPPRQRGQDRSGEA
eukprot:TRINITY_DN957_c0_g2_i1.p1 TRINITY_DN957_c0_g2~~TRINITY_DN957_c0_g2_i1.p1  ORF type:complete len:1019 (+),score=265.48 TRINITY_DN957_c0_g2_i1:130-3186(+)